MSTKQSEQKEIIRLDKSNSRITGSLEERQKRDEGKKKKKERNSIQEPCYLPHWGTSCRDTFQGPGVAIAQETEGVCGLELAFFGGSR